MLNRVIAQLNLVYLLVLDPIILRVELFFRSNYYFLTAAFGIVGRKIIVNQDKKIIAVRSITLKQLVEEMALMKGSLAERIIENKCVEKEMVASYNILVREYQRRLGEIKAKQGVKDESDSKTVN